MSRKKKDFAKLRYWAIGRMPLFAARHSLVRSVGGLVAGSFIGRWKKPRQRGTVLSILRSWELVNVWEHQLRSLPRRKSFSPCIRQLVAAAAPEVIQCQDDIQKIGEGNFDSLTGTKGDEMGWGGYRYNHADLLYRCSYAAAPSISLFRPDTLLGRWLTAP